jgi:hypothetical protein
VVDSNPRFGEDDDVRLLKMEETRQEESGLAVLWSRA